MTFSGGTIAVVNGRYGLMAVPRHDQYVGRSFLEYGEFSQEEVDYLLESGSITDDSIVLDVGANIGALTVPLARHCKRVVAFEPQQYLCKLLTANAAINDLGNVKIIPFAVGDRDGTIDVPALDYGMPDNFGGIGLERQDLISGMPHYPVNLVTLDSVFAPEQRIDFIKIDVEGFEREVIQGARRIIRDHHPTLYVEADRDDKLGALREAIEGMGYGIEEHRPRLYNPDNYYGNRVNLYGDIVSVNWMCYPS